MGCLSFFREVVSLVASFLCYNDVPVASPLRKHPAPTLKTSVPYFASILEISLFIFFPCFKIFLLPSFSGIFKLVVGVAMIYGVGTGMCRIFYFYKMEVRVGD